MGQQNNWDIRQKYACSPESIEWFTEDKAFSPSYDSDPLPPLLPLPSSSCLSFSVFLCAFGQAYWWERGGGEWESIVKHTTTRKPDPL